MRDLRLRALTKEELGFEEGDKVIVTMIGRKGEKKEKMICVSIQESIHWGRKVVYSIIVRHLDQEKEFGVNPYNVIKAK